MKKLLVLVVAFMLLGGITGCGSDDPPRARVANGYYDTINISFKQGTNPTTNINGVEPGEVSGYATIYEGYAVVTGFPSRDTLKFNARNNYEYTVVVQEDSQTLHVKKK